jgi:hypothetical protein
MIPIRIHKRTLDGGNVHAGIERLELRGGDAALRQDVAEGLPRANGIDTIGSADAAENFPVSCG